MRHDATLFSKEKRTETNWLINHIAVRAWLLNAGNTDATHGKVHTKFSHLRRSIALSAGYCRPARTMRGPGSGKLW